MKGSAWAFHFRLALASLELLASVPPGKAVIGIMSCWAVVVEQTGMATGTSHSLVRFGVPFRTKGTKRRRVGSCSSSIGWWRRGSAPGSRAFGQDGPRFVAPRAIDHGIVVGIPIDPGGMVCRDVGRLFRQGQQKIVQR
jgi:hypothetical protein